MSWRTTWRPSKRRRRQPKTRHAALQRVAVRQQRPVAAAPVVVVVVAAPAAVVKQVLAAVAVEVCRLRCHCCRVLCCIGFFFFSCLWHNFRGAQPCADFLERLDALTRRVVEARAVASEAAAYEGKTDKRVCPTCGREQTFEEYRKDIRACTRETCRGAGTFRPAHVWDDVAADFIGRLDTFLRDRDRHAAARVRAALPPFRETHRLEYNAGSGTMESVPIEPSLWSDVATAFFERQKEFEERHAATLERQAAELKERQAAEAAAMQGGPKLNTAYKLSAPLPTFHERQRIAAERRNLSYEERIAEYEAKYGPRP